MPLSDINGNAELMLKVLLESTIRNGIMSLLQESLRLLLVVGTSSEESPKILYFGNTPMNGLGFSGTLSISSLQLQVTFPDLKGRVAQNFA